MSEQPPRHAITPVNTKNPKGTNTWVKNGHQEKVEKAWNARVAGGTWKQAAQIAGYSSEEAAMKAVRTMYGHVPQIDREERRNLWRDRLELVVRQVLRDVFEQKPGAAIAFQRLMHQATLLDGLNEAVKVDVSVTEIFEKLTRELTSHDL